MVDTQILYDIYRLVYCKNEIKQVFFFFHYFRSGESQTCSIIPVGRTRWAFLMENQAYTQILAWSPADGAEGLQQWKAHHQLNLRPVVDIELNYHDLWGTCQPDQVVKATWDDFLHHATTTCTTKINIFIINDAQISSLLNSLIAVCKHSPQLRQVNVLEGEIELVDLERWLSVCPQDAGSEINLSDTTIVVPQGCDKEPVESFFINHSRFARPILRTEA